MTHRGGVGRNKRKSTPPYPTDKKGRNRAFSPPSLPLNSCLKDLPATSKKRKASQSSTVSPPENSTLKNLAMATNCSPISDTNITTNNNNRSRSVSMDGSEYSDSNDTMSTPPSDTDETNKKSLKNYPQSDNKRSNRMPPILIQTTSDHPWRKIAKAMYTKTQGLDQVTAKTTSIPLQIQINCPEESSFRLVQQS
ncbi:unnamed protein product [Macrosiphum euphorbiae]|uniref:Uncharacterized protein n=1 Tax=Macrosiphum euphorbiae TaxID=13131 RepID=A0AAV0XT72_9HEMI|nr:unnamed protein product [Macrosiphum euphorbiae]